MKTVLSDLNSKHADLVRVADEAVAKQDQIAAAAKTSLQLSANVKFELRAAKQALEGTVKGLLDNNECAICMSAPRATIFMPCCHLTHCAACAREFLCCVCECP